MNAQLSWRAAERVVGREASDVRNARRSQLLEARKGEEQSIPGTTSRASMASLYSMKPKPFINLISVISPVPWVEKWPSTSALVATQNRSS